MRQIARMFSATTVAAAVVLGAFAAPAFATGSLPTITSAFTPSLVGVSETTALSFKISNPTASSISAVAFTDTLPAGLAVDNPNGVSGTCGSSGTITAAPGTQTISLSGGSIAASGSCTFSVDVIANQAGALTNDTGLVDSSVGTSLAGDTEVLTALPEPTVAVTSPRNNARYTFGQAVTASFTCAQPTIAADLTDCSASDDLDNTIAPGGHLDTRHPGSHNLTVIATSLDGDITTVTVNYTVLPDNRFTVSKPKSSSSGAVSVTLALPGAGKVDAVETAGKTAFGDKFVRVNGKRKLKLTIQPSSAGSALLANGSTKVTLKITFTPKGGIKRTLALRGIAVG